MEDNFYKVSSEKLFPKSKKIDTQLQQAKRAYEKEAPIISETIARLKKQVDFYQSISSIKTENDPEQFMREVAINKRVSEILECELKRLEGIAKTYGKE
ncbi:hypothetical protein IJI55_00875 [Candidatus Saccharibacteria bacterium]|nr:hypothetical protein [Candidatus Saccharibacteria bacterium]